MATIPNNDDPSDLITISTIGQRIELRIGWEIQGYTRYAKLKISEARKVAEELSRQADSLAAANRAKKERADRIKAEGLDGLF